MVIIEVKFLYSFKSCLTTSPGGYQGVIHHLDLKLGSPDRGLPRED